MRKKIPLLTLYITTFAVHAAAQTVTGTEFTLAPSDTFSDSSHTMSNYGLTWADFSNGGIGPSAMLSGYGGLNFYTSGVRRVTIDWRGNVGIGLTNPANKLDVLGGVAIGGYAGNVAPVNGLMVSGDVGIGTTTPAAKLDVGDTAGNGALKTVFGRLGEGNTDGDGTYLGVRSCSTQPVAALAFSLEHHFYGQANSSINFYRGGSTTGGFLSFATGANAERMRIDASGDVGIGTMTPGAKLEVNGSLKLTSGTGGSITFADGTVQSTAYTGVTCGGDYAESVNISSNHAKYEPGDVLIIAPDDLGDVVKSSGPYSTSVVGIYSTKPGVIGRRQTTSKTPDEIPMAMIGIVPTKVSAENGPIRRGDLLVTSSREGYAMKGTDRGRLTGAVLGKALGNLDSGTGLIEVVVTLQ